MTNYAYIDVGSNSVRLLLNGKKYLTNTQLAEKLVPGGNILPEAAARTRRIAEKNSFILILQT